MSRYIDADALKQSIPMYQGEYPIMMRAVRTAIDAAPTADVVEVVRCKDCKFNVANMEIDENDETDYSGKDIVCSYFMTDGMEENDYCSRGKRRENGN